MSLIAPAISKLDQFLRRSAPPQLGELLSGKLLWDAASGVFVERESKFLARKWLARIDVENRNGWLDVSHLTRSMSRARPTGSLEASNAESLLQRYRACDPALSRSKVARIER